MANMISLKEEPSDLHMSNGLTDVFLDVLALSGSALARTKEEKQLIVWLAEQDQSRLGGGTVGFDLCELPWNPCTFEENRAFLLQVVAEARARLGWERLSYHPNEALLFPCLDKFSDLLAKMDVSQACPDVLANWLADADVCDPVRNGFPKCPRHNTLLTWFGCHICNN